MGMAKRRFNANGGEGSATKYCAFISHQKSEGATIARFLHDSFQVICEADAFLDSADLFDLRDLMTHLQQSEAVVFVATRSALVAACPAGALASCADCVYASANFDSLRAKGCFAADLYKYCVPANYTS